MVSGQTVGHIRYFRPGLAVVIIAGTLAWMWIVGGNPRRYEIFGILIAAGVALPLERLFLRYRPGDDSPRSAMPRVLLGTAGIAALLVWDRSQSEQALLLGTWTAGIATL